MRTKRTDPLITEAEYLAFERASEERHEYQDGVIYTMDHEPLPYQVFADWKRTQSKSKKMGLPKTKHLYTEQEYLDFERTSEERHEYQDGDIYQMAGEKLPHGQISANLVIALGSQLKGSPCQVLTKDTKVRSGPVFKLGESRKGRYSYPDVLVVCGEPEYVDEAEEVILNPKVLVEVLSKSTEGIDRGDKCERYQKWNESLSDYILVSQTQPLIEHFIRGRNGSWTFKRYFGLDALVPIRSIKCTLKLEDVFDRVVFEDSESE